MYTSVAKLILFEEFYYGVSLMHWEFIYYANIGFLGECDVLVPLVFVVWITTLIGRSLLMSLEFVDVIRRPEVIDVIWRPEVIDVIRRPDVQWDLIRYWGDYRYLDYRH